MFDHLAPEWEPCGPRCGCSALTIICWGPLDAPRPDDRQPQGESLRLFTPAPEQMPGQMSF